jgi:hypothetical protein
LYISLVRNTRDFVPTGNGFIGLREFYPNLPKAKAAANGKKTKKGKKAKRKAAPHTARSKDAPKDVKPPDEKPHPGARLKEVISDVMKSGDFMDAKDILRNVEQHMGSKVAPISVYGMLRSKGSFEKNADGKYRVLAQA